MTKNITFGGQVLTGVQKVEFCFFSLSSPHCMHNTQNTLCEHNSEKLFLVPSTNIEMKN